VEAIKVWDLDDFSMVHNIENECAYPITMLIVIEKEKPSS